MTTRAQRLLESALHRTGLSYEAFADEYPAAVGYKSGRSLRRYADGKEIPYYIVDALRAFLDTHKEK